jgi:hypothetical protein
LSGTPTAVGTYTFAVFVYAIDVVHGIDNITLTVGLGPQSISFNARPAALPASQRR